MRWQKFIVIILLLSISLSLYSCSTNEETPGDQYFYPENYTCGFPNYNVFPNSLTEIWWVETYEECLEAINLLKSHDSTFMKSAIFTYEGDLFDTKYCFIIKDTPLVEKISFGDNPFDRHAVRV